MLDLDGVVVNLRQGMRDAWATTDFACPSDEAFEEWFQKPMRWTSGPVLTQEFWTSLPAYSWTKDLLSAIREYGEVRVCSNPGRKEFAHAAASGKHLWCQKHLKMSPRSVTLAADKWLLACPGRVLIDDSLDNIKAWKDAGGIGILFPQAYNSSEPWCDADPVSYMRMKLDAL